MVIAALAVAVLGVSAARARAASYGPPIYLGHGWHAPWGIAVNSSGDLFVANAAVYSPSPSIIERFPDGTEKKAGSGFKRANDVVLNSAGHLFVSDSSKHRIVEVNPGHGERKLHHSTASPRQTACVAPGPGDRRAQPADGRLGLLPSTRAGGQRGRAFGAGPGTRKQRPALCQLTWKKCARPRVDGFFPRRR
jgi:hypothetical protein